MLSPKLHAMMRAYALENQKLAAELYSQARIALERFNEFGYLSSAIKSQNYQRRAARVSAEARRLAELYQ